jgi:hypothetical protein
MYRTETGIAGIGVIRYHDSYDDRTYIGEIKNGTADGKGTINRENGSVYTGEVYDGFAHGYGKYEYNDEHGYTKMCGNYKDDWQHGYGEHYYSDGSSYKGDFIDDDYNGYGILTFPHDHDYLWFKGEFVDHEPYKGVYKFVNGDTILIDRT